MPQYHLGIMVLIGRCVMRLAKLVKLSTSSAWKLLANDFKILMCFYHFFFVAYIPNVSAD